MTKLRRVLLFALCLTVFAGCGSDSGVETTGLSGQSVEIPTTIPANARFAQDAVLIKMRTTPAVRGRGFSARDVAELSEQADVGLRLQQDLPNGVKKMAIDSEDSVEETMAALQSLDEVEYVEPDYWIKPDLSEFLPDDPRFNDLWGLRNLGQTGGTPGADISATRAWAKTLGSPEIIVGVIDTGVDYSHPDLRDNMWVNTKEIPNNGFDDDGNGWVDDVYGIDAFANDGDPRDEGGHGTHVAGTIAAADDNVGVIGVAPNVRIMALRFLGPQGGYTSDAVKCIDYAIAHGAHLTNNSWGGGGSSRSLQDAINRAAAANQLFVAAAGNNGRDTDSTPSYPAAYNLDNIISVGASDAKDQKASFSNFGRTTVDLFAPGVSILSSLPNNRYGRYSGTSMASPHAAGVAALVLSVNANLPFAEVKDALLSQVDAVPAFANLSLTGGRLNAFKAVESVESAPPPPPPAPVLVEATPNLVKPGDVVTLSGANFGQSGAVVFQPGDITFASLSWSDDKIQVTVSDNVSGEGTVQVRREDGELSGTVGLIVRQGEPLGRPTDLKAVLTEEKDVQLTWTDNAYAETEVLVYRKTIYRFGPREKFQLIATLPANSTSYRDDVPVDGVKYAYRVRMRNESRRSKYSQSVTIEVPGPQPEALEPPAGLKATVAEDGSVLLTWEDRNDHEIGYRILARRDGDRWRRVGTILESDVTSVNLRQLEPGQPYRFKVRTFSQGAISKDSNQASLTTP